MKPILILLNGELSEEIKKIKPDDYDDIVCADGAINSVHLKTLPIKIVFGDFDSIKEKKDDITYIELIDQNYTDFEKIIMYYLDKEKSFFHIYGGSGIEQDHFLGHLSIAKKYLNKTKIIFFDDYHRYFLSDKNVDMLKCKNKMISIIPMPEVYGLSYKGLQYPLNNADLKFGEQIGTRNKGIEEKVSITFKSGCIAIFKER